ncbi:hypothetical protein GQ457_01G043000 [Hibiscus cannabinus]
MWREGRREEEKKKGREGRGGMNERIATHKAIGRVHELLPTKERVKFKKLHYFSTTPPSSAVILQHTVCLKPLKRFLLSLVNLLLVMFHFWSLL